MLTKSDDIQRLFATRHDQCRADLMDRLQAFLPPSIMLPSRRLMSLLHQAAELQTERCLYHNSSGPIELDASCLAVDHQASLSLVFEMNPLLHPRFSLWLQCSKDNFPHETIQVLNDHSEEVWFCRFSPDGLKLATGSKDLTLIIWDFDPLTLKLKHNKTLDRNNHGVSYFAWSPDSTRLAVCGPEDCDEVPFLNKIDEHASGTVTVTCG